VDDNFLLQNRAEYIKVLEDQPGWRKNAWRHGDWNVASGAFFDTFSERHHVVDEIDEVRRPRGWGLSFDFGYTHYSVATLGFWDGEGNWWIVDEHCARKWLPERNAEAIHAMLARHGQKTTTLDYMVAGTDIFAKESGGTSVAQQYQDLGLYWRPAITDRINGAAEIARLLGDPDDEKSPKPPKLKIHKRCVRLIDNLPNMVHDPNRPEDVLKVDVDDDGNGGDDSYDSFRYLVAQRMGRSGGVANTRGENEVRITDNVVRYNRGGFM
jgi:hypothetical protein